MRYMLDTAICHSAMNERLPKVLHALRALHAGALGVSCITASEWHYGVARTGSARNAAASRRFLASLEVADFDLSAGEVACRLGAWRCAQRKPIGPYDSLIATHAHSLGVTLVTNNTREFERVPGLALSNWAE